MSATVKKETTATKGLMPILEGMNVNSRKIICPPNVSPSDRDGIVRLYEALVPRKEIGKMRIKVIKQYFPSFENIDIGMIMEEGFPMFEKTIGVQNFAKVKRYFGIGCKVSKNQNSREIEVLLAKLRTIENAQYYICGYKELISKTANLLEGGEQYTDIEKAKIVRFYSILILWYIYFVEDLGYQSQINHVQLKNNNKLGFYPEELFVLFASRFTDIPEKNIFYDSIMFELNLIEDKKVLKELLEFSELDYKYGRFYSVNRANPYQNFSQIRNLKQRIHKEYVISPIELFGIIKFARQIDFADLYAVYKAITSCKLDKFKRVERDFERYEGSIIIKQKYFCYEIRPEQYLTGEREKGRLINLLETFARKDLTMRLESDLKTGKELPEKKKKEYNVAEFLGAIKFVQDANLVQETTVIRDFEIADTLIKRDKRSKVLSKYFMNTVTIEEVKEKLKIDETFELDFFGIKPKVDHKAVLMKFAIQNGYAADKNKIPFDIIEKLIISGNEELIERYNSGEISDKQFESELGIEGFVEMFFDLSKVDIALIEEKLLKVKKTSIENREIDKAYKMIVRLYCYLVEGQISCGPKNRKPERRGDLKTSILNKLYLRKIEE